MYFYRRLWGYRSLPYNIPGWDHTIILNALKTFRKQKLDQQGLKAGENQKAKKIEQRCLSVMGAAFGNGILLSSLERVLTRGLYAVGLTKIDMEDAWETAAAELARTRRRVKNTPALVDRVRARLLEHSRSRMVAAGCWHPPLAVLPPHGRA